jgi:hypothetical protein
MNTRHPRRISRKAAEQLLDGAAGLDQRNPRAPGGPDQLARVLAAAAAPAREHELAGEHVAVAAFEAHHLESVASDQRGQMIKSPLAKLLTTKVIAAALTVSVGGGVALAASTGTFSGPGPASLSPTSAASSTSAPGGVPLVSPSASGSATASAAASAAAPSTGPLSPTADPPTTSSPAASSPAVSVPKTAAGLCHALISAANGAGSQVAALASGTAAGLLSSKSEFSPLISTAGSAAAVPDYCALLLDLPQLPQPSELTQLPVSVLSSLLTQLPTATLAQILTSLPSSTLSAVLTELPASTVAQLLGSLPSAVQTQILNELPTSTVSQLLNELPSSLVSTLSGLSGLSSSVQSLLPGLGL